MYQSVLLKLISPVPFFHFLMWLPGNLKLHMRLLFEADMIFLLNNADLEVMEARTRRKKKPHQSPISKNKTSSYNPRICLIDRGLAKLMKKINKCLPSQLLIVISTNEIVVESI